MNQKKRTTLFSTITLVFFINFYHLCTIGNRNEYSTKNVQNIQLHLNCVSTLPGKTKRNKNSWPFSAVCFVKLVDCNFCSCTVFLFPYSLRVCWRIIFTIFCQKIFYTTTGFHQNFIIIHHVQKKWNRFVISCNFIKSWQIFTVFFTGEKHMKFATNYR